MSVRSAIVVEGGAMRGVFSAGVLDAFAQRGFDPFEVAIGVSAGACNLASHLAEQRGRNRRCYFDVMTRPEFIDVRRALAAGSVVDLDWLWDAFARLDPLDVSAVVRSPKEFVVVATSAATGEPVYLEPGEPEMLAALKGSCALPLLYRGIVRVGGSRVVDGGVADPIPAEEAYRRGARAIVVLRSRPTGGQGPVEWLARAPGRVASWLLRGEPALARAVGRMPARYEACLRFLRHPPPDCRIVEVAPAFPLATGGLTRDRPSLEHDYALGLQAGHHAVERWGDPSADLVRTLSRSATSD